MLQIKKLNLTHKKDLRIILNDFNLVLMMEIRQLLLEKREMGNRH